MTPTDHSDVWSRPSETWHGTPRSFCFNTELRTRLRTVAGRLLNQDERRPYPLQRPSRRRLGRGFDDAACAVARRVARPRAALGPHRAPCCVTTSTYIVRWSCTITALVPITFNLFQYSPGPIGCQPCATQPNASAKIAFNLVFYVEQIYLPGLMLRNEPEELHVPPCPSCWRLLRSDQPQWGLTPPDCARRLNDAPAPRDAALLTPTPSFPVPTLPGAGEARHARTPA